MTTAIFSQNGTSFEASISGHAGYNLGGPDIVCSACSVLTYTLLQCILAEEAHGAFQELHTTPDGGKFCMGGGDDGYFYIGVRCASLAQSRIEGIFDVITSGFALLSKQYPDFVKLSVRTGEK